MITQEVQDAIRAHAIEVFPFESCGVLIMTDGVEQYFPCKNLKPSGDLFQMDPEDYAHAEDHGEVSAIVHSHPYAQPEPSEADKVACEASGVRWIIFGWPVDRFVEFEPSGYVPPLVGREFAWGVLDCYTEVTDYYKVTLGIILPPRPADWAERRPEVYFDMYKEYGFEKVDTPQLHDLVLMKLGVASQRSGHAGIYLGDNVMLHHPERGLSAHVVYGGYWRKNTVAFIRHKSLMQSIAAPK